MKKTLKFIFSLILVLTISISAFGCSWIKPTEGGGDLPPTVPGYGTEVSLPDSLIEAENVIFNSLTAEEREQSNMTMQQAVTMVKRSSVIVATNVGTGSGVIIDVDDGKNQKNTFYVLTCHHVIRDAVTASVYVPDLNYRYANDKNYVFEGKIGGTRTAKQELSLVGGDQKSDVAVLKLYIEDDAIASNIVKAKITDRAYPVTEGQSVFAIGNPTGKLPGTVTDGIISYTFRSAQIENIGTMQLHQISAQTNPGSSGGGLFNLYGELIGITNAGNETNLTYYAIPHVITDNPATDKGFVNIIKQLIATCTDDNYGYISNRKATIGFTFSQRTNGQSTQVVITEVTSGSVAEEAGLRVNDIIRQIEVNGVKTDATSVSSVSNKIEPLNPGDSFTFHLQRGNSLLQITFKIYQEYFHDTGIYPSVE